MVYKMHRTAGNMCGRMPAEFFRKLVECRRVEVWFVSPAVNIGVDITVEGLGLRV